MDVADKEWVVPRRMVGGRHHPKSKSHANVYQRERGKQGLALLSAWHISGKREERETLPADLVFYPLFG